MARAKSAEVKPDFVDNGEEIDETLLTTAPDDWEFETVADESPARVLFEKPGEVFIGQYVGIEHIEPDNGDDPFDLYTFRGRDGNLYALNTSYKLRQAMDKVEPGQWTRVTFVKEIPVTKGNPLKDFKVDVRK